MPDGFTAGINTQDRAPSWRLHHCQRSRHAWGKYEIPYHLGHVKLFYSWTKKKDLLGGILASWSDQYIARWRHLKLPSRYEVPINPSSLQLSLFVDFLPPNHVRVGKRRVDASRIDWIEWRKKREEGNERARDPSIHPSICDFFFSFRAGERRGTYGPDWIEGAPGERRGDDAVVQRPTEVREAWSVSAFIRVAATEDMAAAKEAADRGEHANAAADSQRAAAATRAWASHGNVTKKL
jgi:hypothetical protein